MSDRQLIADLLSALEYHTEQTRPIEVSRVAIEAAREYLRKPAQQEHKPWCASLSSLMFKAKRPCDCKRVPLPPPASKPWVGLTTEEVKEISLANRPYVVDMVVALEQRLKEKNA